MLDKKRTILIVTDVQGALAEQMFQREQLYKNLGVIIDGIKALEIPILWTEQYPKGLGNTVQEVATHLDEYVPLPKKTFSSLRDIEISEHFSGLNRDQVIITGIETHICIYQTAMDFLERDIETHVVEDAVSSRTEFNKRIGLGRIARAGGHITSVESVLFELLQVAEGDAFKQILKLVK